MRRLNRLKRSKYIDLYPIKPWILRDLYNEHLSINYQSIFFGLNLGFIFNDGWNQIFPRQCGGRKKAKNIKRADCLRNLQKTSNTVEKVNKSGKRRSSIRKSLHALLPNLNDVVVPNIPPNRQSMNDVVVVRRLNEINELSREVTRMSIDANLQNGVKILSGSFSQCSEEMSNDTMGTQCTSMSLMSIVHSISNPPSQWTTNNLDKILKEGDKLLGKSIKIRYAYLQRTKQLVPNYKYLSVDDLIKMNPIEFANERFDIESENAIISDAYFEPEAIATYNRSTTRREYEFAFGLVFPRFNNCILTIGIYTYAILYEQNNEREIYHFFIHIHTMATCQLYFHLKESDS